MATVIVPPIKSQGIKTKLVPWINDLILSAGVDLNARWIEPFFGTGVVGFNSPMRGSHIVGDTNPHIINFYKGVQRGEITEYSMRAYLEEESKLLSSADEEGYAHFRLVRNRFNFEHSPYDFIFLSRAGFNGMMRFNRYGEWNIPFCKKPDRFSPAYITKICNQIHQIGRIIRQKEWEFNNISFITPAKFILSTWHHNDFRPNEMIKRYWGRFNITTKNHFYHNGGSIENRHSVVEALVFNFDLHKKQEIKTVKQLELFAEAV